MRRLGFAGLILPLLSFALRGASAQATAAKSQANKVKQTARPIEAVAMGGPRVVPIAKLPAMLK